MVLLALLAVFALPSAPAGALDLNGFRAAAHRRPLHYNGALAAMASRHANDLARRNHLDHSGFRESRVDGGARAENVSYGCGDESCAIRQWSRSGRHRANMLRADVSGYGLASAISAGGRRYWVLILGH
jgi:uncharacterized protein YkwD